MNRAAEPYVRLNEVVQGFAASRILQVAVELDVFSRLANEGKTAAQLSTLLHVHPGALELFLNALTSLGFLRKEAERFYDTPISHTYLSKAGPKYLGHLIRHQAHEWDDWGRLEEAVRTGKPVRKPDMYQDSPKELDLFVRGMHELALARGDARWLARAIPLRRCRKLLDVGGGPGTYAAMFCRSNRALQATVMDLPATLKVTRKILRDFDMTGRVATMSGDYRTDKIKGVPYDVALVSNVLHAEDEPTNRQVLRKVYEALTPGGILIIKDHIMNADHTEPHNGAIFALEMLLGTRGRTYSFDEVAAWLAKIGYQDSVEVPIEPPANVSLVLAVRPGKRHLIVLPRPAAKVEPESATEANVAAEGNGSSAAELAARASAERGAKKASLKAEPKPKSKPAPKAKAGTAQPGAKSASRNIAKSKAPRKAGSRTSASSRKNSNAARSGNRKARGTPKSRLESR